MSTATPGWYPDPFGRADVRWWSGADWTDQIAIGGELFVDSPDPAGPPPTAPSGEGSAAPLNRPLLFGGLAVVAAVAIGAVVLTGDDGDPGASAPAISTVDTAAGDDAQSSEQIDAASDDLSAPPAEPVDDTTMSNTPASPCAGYLYVSTIAPSIEVIDAATGGVNASIALDGDARGRMAVAPNGSTAYVVNTEGSSVSVVDLAARSVLAPIALVAESGVIEAIGSHEPSGVVFAPDGGSAYVLSYYGDSSVNAGLWVIDAATNTVREQVNLEARPADLAISPDGGLVYITAESGRVDVLDTATNAVVDTVLVDGRLDGIGLSPDGTRAYVADRIGQQLFVLDTASRSVVSTIPTGEYPIDAVVSPDGATVYVTTEYGESIEAVDTATGATNATIFTDEEMAFLSISSDGTGVYALDVYGGVWKVDTATEQLTSLASFDDWPRGIAAC